MKTFLTILWYTAYILFIDFLGWLGWALSGQAPVDNWYIGTITAHIIKLFN